MKLTKFLYLYPEKPGLITLDQSLMQYLSDSPDWIAERKHNGSRLELHCNRGNFKFWGRHGSELKYQPATPVINALVELGLTGYYLFDGELLHNKVKGVRNQIVLYDCFIWKGELLVNQPFAARRKLLEQLNLQGPISIPEWFTTDFKKVFGHVTTEMGIEGLVLKNKKGMLNLGRTSAKESSWMYKLRIPTKNYRH